MKEFIHEPRVAYFSMEIALRSDIPTYSGGLGVLAGDTLRAAADLGLPLVAVTLLHRTGYFQQSLSPDGHQDNAPVQWEPSDLLTKTSARASVAIEGREVHLTAWRYDIPARNN